MTVTCPVCGHESDREWRCEQCQRDLVDESDGPERPLRPDGSGEYYVRDASEDRIVAGPFLREPIALLAARAQGTDCAVVPRSDLDVAVVGAEVCEPAHDCLTVRLDQLVAALQELLLVLVLRLVYGLS